MGTICTCRSAASSELGIAGVIRGRRKRPVDADPRRPGPADLVDRHFADSAQGSALGRRLHVCLDMVRVGLRRVRCSTRTPYILGWRAATSMTTPLVLDCLEMALWTRRREGIAGFIGLTHHTDAGSVYTSISFTDRLVDEGIDASVSDVGDAYDNALAESQIGLYKSGLIHHEGPWRDVDQVEVTTGWVQWFNTEHPTARSMTSPP